MGQPTFADLEYESKKRKTRWEIFLERMDSLIPWDQLEARIRPFYARAGRGRRPYALSAMLRIRCVQLFYNLSDPGMEDMLYEAESVRRFVRLKLSEPLPDETAILRFRQLLEEHKLGEGVVQAINRRLESQGLRLQEGTMVDADTGMVHSVTMTPANVNDVTEAHRLLHGGEKRVWSDAGRQGVEKRAANRELEVAWLVAMRPGKRRRLEPGSHEALEEKRKASVRAKVEHPFLYVKPSFGYAQVRYRGLHRNTQRLALLLGLGNLMTAERHLAT